MNGSTRLVYTIMAALGAVVMALAGIDRLSLNHTIDKLELRVTNLESGQENRDDRIGSLRSEVRAWRHESCLQECALRKDFDDFRQDHLPSGRTLFRQQCVCPLDGGVETGGTP